MASIAGAGSKRGVPVEFYQPPSKRIRSDYKLSPCLKEKWTNVRSRLLLITRGAAKCRLNDYQPILLRAPYWAEAYLSDHFAGFKISKAYRRWKPLETEKSFTQWLTVSQPPIEEKVTYLDVNERVKHQVLFESIAGNAKLILNNKTLDTRGFYTLYKGSGTGIFVIGPDENLYVGSHNRGYFHHSSFLSGGAVIGAGEITVNCHGLIESFSLKSGHYNHGLIDENREKQALLYFQKKGINLSKVVYQKLIPAPAESWDEDEIDELNAEDYLRQLS